MLTLHRIGTYLTAALVGVLLLGGCRTEQSNIGTSISDILANPESYYGDLVTVSGEVDRVLGERMFSIGGHDFDDDLLVISLDAIAPQPGRTADEPFWSDDIVQVTGTVEPMDVASLEEKYGLDLEDSLAEEFAGWPVVVVGQSVAAELSGVTVTPRGARPAPGDEPLLTDLTAVIHTPDQHALVDRLALFRNANVIEVVSEHVFWIGTGDDERLLVVMTPPQDIRKADEICAGDVRTVYGVLRELPAPGLLKASWKLPEEVVQALEGRAVYLHAIGADRA